MHLLWCHVLLFVRTMNFQLLHDSNDYRRTMSVQLSYFWTRVQALLDFGNLLQDQKFDDSRAITLALYEELELITGIVGQYFDYTDELYAMDYDRYCEIKDLLLQSVMGLFSKERQITYSSSTE